MIRAFAKSYELLKSKEVIGGNPEDFFKRQSHIRRDPPLPCPHPGYQVFTDAQHYRPEPVSSKLAP